MSSSTYFNGYNFVVNSCILEKIHSYNLSLNEFLLLLYFLNVDDKQFILTDLKKHLKLSKEEILSSLNVLIEKDILSLETKKDDDGVIREYISLTKFFKALDNVDTSSDDFSNIKTYLTDECNLKLKNTDLEIIKVWIDRGFTYDVIKDAVDKSLYNGSFDLRFIDKLLFQSESKDSSHNKKNDEVLFDYNWLDEDKK